MFGTRFIIFQFLNDLKKNTQEIISAPKYIKNFELVFTDQVEFLNWKTQDSLLANE